MSRTVTLTGRLSRLGFDDVPRAERLLADPALVDVLGPIDPDSAHLHLLGEASDPDLAVLTLARLCEAVRSDPDLRGQLRGIIAQDSAARRLAAVAGGSTALGDDLVRRPAELLPDVADPTPATGVDAHVVRAELLTAVGADSEADVPVASLTGPAGVDALRRAYRSRLLRIAATDLTASEPLTLLPGVGAALADLAAAALEAALAWARAATPDGGRCARFTVIGMGKTGGRELNYVSDVDVIYVVEPADGATEAEALTVGAKLAAGLAHACGGSSGEPSLWPVDAALRPEGKQGPIVRTLASHVSYYERWAKTWEFQALLKARPVAGDLDLGEAYRAAVQPMVWAAVGRDNFVEDSQAMRRRVEDNVPAVEADRQIKLGKGGLRDVEFTVQLLQLVHGRGDESLRSGNTLTALAALAASGYVARSDAGQLAVCYRFLRVLEHRIQLRHLRRTHLMPTDPGELRALSRAAGMRSEGTDGMMARWRATRRDVRTLHEELFYRPLLPAVAQLSQDEAALAPEAARARLQAIGYRDPAGAMRHIEALTEGLSRRAAIQRQLLPVMLGWFADGADPDRGLLAFRRLSDDLGSAHWYLKLLRDSTSAASRLAKVLSNSQFMADSLSRSPESVHWLADNAELHPLGRERLDREVDAILGRADEEPIAASALRAVRRRELTRIAAAELLSVSDQVTTQIAISDVTDVTLVGGLRIAEYSITHEMSRDHGEPPADMLVVAMGRLGGREMSYGSDADVMYVYEPRAGTTERVAHDYAVAVATRLRTVLSAPGDQPPLEVDPALRPEGRNGPLVRSFESYMEYYARWSEAWERQALLRARPVAGSGVLGRRFMDLIDPLRYPAGGLDPAVVRDVRRIKARVEAERLPRGVSPARHLKLGPGGIADVEWTVQLLQLQHGGAVPSLRTTQTLQAMKAAVAASLISAEDAEILEAAWLEASRIRNGVALWSGRLTGANSNVLPHDRRDLAGVAQAIGFPGTGSELEEHYLRVVRRARAVVTHVFYGLGPESARIEV